jgi:two-component system, OmpR family, sensor histidine kinase KdpD
MSPHRFLSWQRPSPSEFVRVASLGILTLAAATVAVAALRSTIGVTYPAPVYLLPVLAVGMRYGTVPAVLTSVGAFLLYDFFFTRPYYTLTIHSPDEWLNLLLLLAVSVAIGRLAALLAERAREVADRAREAEALHSITGILANTRTVAEAAPAIVTRLEQITAMDRVWVALGATPNEERVLADTGAGAPVPQPGWQVVLQRTEGDLRWVRVHMGPGGQRRASRAVLYRIRVEVAGENLGSLWALRVRHPVEPDRAERRILSAAADQLGQAVVRDQLTAEATSAEIARQGEALKTALLDSVSHDLRTPLATIRAAAGSMLDPEVDWSPQEQREAFEAIDAEADRMGRLVRNLLDLSRIEGGALKPELEAQDVGELVAQAVAHVPAAGKSVEVRVPADLPAVLVDEVYVAQVLVNLLENAVRYGGRSIQVRARSLEGGRAVELSVQDDGDGVPASALAHLFEKFYQVPREVVPGRRGMGIGLTVVAGLVGAMGGSVKAGRGELGGLSVAFRLRAVEVPEDVGASAPIEAGAAEPSAGGRP